EELDALAAAGVCCEMVPGVTAALAAAAESKMPLTHRGVARSVAFATLRQRRGVRSAAPTLPRADTLMLYMARGDIEGTRQALLAAGYAADTPVVRAANIAMPGATLQRATIATLTALPESDPAAPVLLGGGATFGDVLSSEEERAPSVTPMRACAR
ncbi:MAG: SAM-dependent methyltransferase, partial [Casimicrobiaceae bacterium]